MTNTHANVIGATLMTLSLLAAFVTSFYLGRMTAPVEIMLPSSTSAIALLECKLDMVEMTLNSQLPKQTVYQEYPNFLGYRSQ